MMSSNSNNISAYSYNWADLPKELLQIIGKHLETRIDVFRFRAVSTSWRSVVSLSNHQTQLSLSPLSLDLPPPINATMIISPAIIYRLEDETRTSACLVKVSESSSSGKMQLSNPLSPFYIPNNNKICNLLDLRLVEVTRCYNFQFKTRPSRNIVIKKMVLFENCGILALFDTGQLGYRRPGNEELTFLGNEGTCYDDFMVYKNDQFYVIDSLGIISWIDNSMNLVQYSPPLCGLGHLKTLVESDGQFYVVDSYMEEWGGGDAMVQVANVGFRKIRRRVDMKVYKLDEEWGTWVQVKSLGDRIFVLAKEACFSVSVSDFPGCQGNCIYFVDPKPEDQLRRPNDRVDQLRRPSGRAYRLYDGRIKTVESFPYHRRLFSPSINWQFSAPSSPLPTRP